MMSVALLVLRTKQNNIDISVPTIESCRIIMHVPLFYYCLIFKHILISLPDIHGWRGAGSRKMKFKIFFQAQKLNEYSFTSHLFNVK